MSRTRGVARLAELLMRGPRGRRLLLEYAVRSEQLHDPEYREDSLGSGVFLASYHLDPGKGTSVVLFGPGAAEAEMQEVTPKEISRRLASTPLAEATPQLLRDCLVEAVGSARYWQEPDGHDVLAASSELQAPLRRVADHVAASAHAGWWSEPMEEHSQWQVGWDGESAHTISPDPPKLLRQAHAAALDEELRAQRERPADPTARWSGDWWSHPPRELPSSTRALFDGSPAGLWFVEDDLGWEQAQARGMSMPAGLRICEIDTADAWADLCLRFPFEVTAGKRHDWYRTTGRAGAWVLPDWARVAEEYDAVHLQALAYLSAAGTAIPVDERRSSVIAGWNPDQTFWFTPRVRYADESVSWALQDRGERGIWTSESRR